MTNSWTDQVRKKFLNFFESALVGGMVAAVLALLFYPMWSDSREYMVEWAIALITAGAAWVVANVVSSGYSVRVREVVVIGVIILWVFVLAGAVRNHTIAQLPCTTRERTTCWACTETEYTQSGEQCMAGEEYECEVCTERTWRAREWK